MIKDFTSRVGKIYQGHNYIRAVRKAVDYIGQHLFENPEIEEICRVSELSRAQLSLRFKRETGKTIKEFVQNQKIEKAKEMLVGTKMNLLEISTELGFSSQNYFQKGFKEIVKITPQKFRNLN